MGPEPQVETNLQQLQPLPPPAAPPPGAPPSQHANNAHLGDDDGDHGGTETPDAGDHGGTEDPDPWARWHQAPNGTYEV